MATQKLNIDIVAKDRSKRALNNLQTNLGKLKASVFNLRNAFIGLGAGLVIRNIVNTGKQIENLQVQLKFLFGSAQEGAKAFDEMAKFASKVPFSLEEIQRGSGVLAVVSDDADELANLMKITGNVAAVTGLDFKTTAEQIQRSLSAGISAADLFRDKGVKDMLGFKAGATVSIEETVAAFERVFGEGGRFDGATDELAKTFSGTLSMIGDKVFNFKRTLLDAGFFSQLKAQFGDLNKSLEKNSEAMDKIAITIGTVMAVAVEKVANGIKLIAKFSDELGFALKVIISLKIGAMFVRWAIALRTVYLSLAAIVGLSGVGLKLVAASAVAAGAAYYALGIELDKIEKKINKNFIANKQLMSAGPWTMREGTKHGAGPWTMFGEGLDSASEKIKTIQEQFRELNQGAITKIEEKFKNVNTIIATGISSGITKMSDSLARSIILGEKLSDTFKKMAGDLLVKILSITIEVIARKGVELAIEKLITKEKATQAALSNASGFFGTVGKIFSGGKQHGGAVSKGRPTLVGERGPELFIPNQTGQITQNARGTGGGSVSVNFSITTLDATGFSEMLAQNRGTITSIINNAMNEKGARGIV